MCYGINFKAVLCFRIVFVVVIKALRIINYACIVNSRGYMDYNQETMGNSVPMYNDSHEFFSLSFFFREKRCYAHEQDILTSALACNHLPSADDNRQPRSRTDKKRWNSSCKDTIFLKTTIILKTFSNHCWTRFKHTYTYTFVVVCVYIYHLVSWSSLDKHSYVKFNQCMSHVI